LRGGIRRPRVCRLDGHAYLTFNQCDPKSPAVQSNVEHSAYGRPAAQSSAAIPGGIVGTIRQSPRDQYLDSPPLFPPTLVRIPHGATPELPQTDCQE